MNEVSVSLHKSLECDILWIGRYWGFIHHIADAADGAFLGFVGTGLTGVAGRREAMDWESTLATITRCKFVTVVTGIGGRRRDSAVGTVTFKKHQQWLNWWAMLIISKYIHTHTYTVFHKKGTALFSTTLSQFLVDFYNSGTSGIMNVYSRINCNLLT